MKLNNKGFAISTVIYGLSIMGILLIAIVMATMAATRSNSRQLAKSIEDELNRFSKTETFFNPKSSSGVPTSQEYIVPTSGWYKIELWGSKGGTDSYGAYTSGLIKLEEGEVLYFYVGENGRETDVRVITGGYNDSYSAGTRIMVAAGGGSGNDAPGGTLYGYNSKMKSVGGCINSNADYNIKADLCKKNSVNTTNGTLVGFPSNYEVSSIKQKNVGESFTPKATTNSGGGDGYYPSDDPNTGGVSFIAGYAGSRPVIKGIVEKNPKVTIYDQSYDINSDNGTVNYGEEKGTYHFIDGLMLASANTEGSGKGKAKIERMVLVTDDSQKLTKKNDKFNMNIAYVIDCVDSTDNNAIEDISIIANGEEMLNSSGLSAPSRTGNKVCRTANLREASTFVDEIAVFHKSGTDYENNTVQICESSGRCEYLKNTSPNTPLSETETVTGTRFSAYQFKSTENLPDRGNYYIKPVLYESRVLTGANTTTNSSNPLEATGINGYKRQRWSIEKIPGTEYYKVYELARYGALSIIKDENMDGNGVGAENKFNSNREDTTQYWRIVPLGNGTYQIITKVEPFQSGTGNIIVQTNPNITNSKKLIIAKNNVTTARFTFISADYSSGN